MLVEFGGDKSLLDFAGLKLELEETLGRSVDVITYRGLSPRIRERVLQQHVRVL